MNGYDDRERGVKVATHSRHDRALGSIIWFANVRSCIVRFRVTSLNRLIGKRHL
jgi:hypothetical protein